MEWYYRRGDDRGGPVDHDVMCDMVSGGALPLDARVWREGFAQFIPAGVLPGFRDACDGKPDVALAPAPGAPLVALMVDPWSPEPGYEPEVVTPEAIPTLTGFTGGRASFVGGQMVDGDGSFLPPADVPQVRPWLRYLARLADTAFFAAILCVVYPQVMTQPLVGWHLLYVPLAFVMGEALCLSAFATTPGKLLLGISVRNADGRRLSVGEAFGRSLGVLVRGQALGLPVAVFFAQIVAWGVLTAEGATTWDLRGNFIVRHARVGALRVLFVLLLVVPAVMSVGKAVGKARPHLRQELSAATGLLRGTDGSGVSRGRSVDSREVIPVTPQRPKPARKPPKKLVL